MSETGVENHFNQVDLKGLTESQKHILDRVIGIIEGDPQFSAQLKDMFSEMTQKNFSDPKKFQAIEKLLDSQTQMKLSKIEDDYIQSIRNGEEADKTQARILAFNKSKEIIVGSTTLKIEAFRAFVLTQKQNVINNQES